MSLRRHHRSLLLSFALAMTAACATTPPPSRLDLRRQYPVHVVQEGDTVYSIARTHGVEPSALIRLNGLSAPDRIFVGQSLLIPRRLTPLCKEPDIAVTTCRTARRAPATGARSGLLWPIKAKATKRPPGDPGRAISEIDAPVGTPVWAAEDGKVVFAGTQAGYGLLLVIKHYNLNVTTVYGRLREACVRVDQWVKRGQVVALVGPGPSERRGSYLYFELRPGAR